MAVCIARDEDMRRQNGMAWCELPHVQVVHFFDMVALRHRHANLRGRYPFRCAFEEYPDGFALEIETRTQHQNGHDERGDRGRGGEAGHNNHDSSDEGPDEGIQVGHDVLKAALDVQALTVRLRHDPRRGKVRYT